MEERSLEAEIRSSVVSPEGQGSEVENASDAPTGRKRLWGRVWESLRKTAPYSSEAGQWPTIVTWSAGGAAVGLLIKIWTPINLSISEMAVAGLIVGAVAGIVIAPRLKDSGIEESH